MADPVTTIGMRDFNTRHRAFRLAASEFDSFDDLLQQTYAEFRCHPREFTLHLHFQPGTSCAPTQLLNAQEWDAGEYFIGGAIEFFAHFVERGDAWSARVPVAASRSPSVPVGIGSLGRAGRAEEREPRAAKDGRTPASAGGRRSSASTAGSRLLPPPRGAQRETSPFGGFGGRPLPPIHLPPYAPSFVVPPVGYPPYRPDIKAPSAGTRFSRGNDPQADVINGRRPSTATHGYTPSQGRSNVTHQRPRGPLNSNSTTIYSLCTPIPIERYGRRQYFSGPYVFIPYPPSPIRQNPATVMTSPPFPGFQQPRPNAVAPRDSPTHVDQPTFEPRRRYSSSSDSLEMLPSPTYEREATVEEPHQQQAAPGRHSSPRSSDSSDGLFVSER